DSRVGETHQRNALAVWVIGGYHPPCETDRRACRSKLSGPTIMPATEETYRPQPLLHLIFAVSSLAMLLSTVWMVMADHLRPWKGFQREFQEIERQKLRAAEKEKDAELKQKSQAQLDEIDAQIKAAEANAETRAAEIRNLDRDLDKLGGRADYL